MRKTPLPEDMILRAWNLYSSAMKEAKKEHSIVQEWERSLEDAPAGSWRRSAYQLAALEAHREKMRRADLQARSVERYLRCGAKTRRGTPCQCKPVLGKRRCSLHGGMSTGAKTPEGRARLSDAARRRWRFARDGVVSESYGKH